MTASDFINRTTIDTLIYNLSKIMKAKKYQAGGVTHTNKKAGMVDPKGAFTKVQQRTIAGKKTPVSKKK